MKDITGEKFNFLTAIQFIGRSSGKSKSAIWLFHCECGVEKEIIAAESHELSLASKASSLHL
jgi:hypothetical protein